MLVVWLGQTILPAFFQSIPTNTLLDGQGFAEFQLQDLFMALDPDALADFFRTRKIVFGRCLEPSMQCTDEAIRAHSIQNSQTIALLENDNHVIAWQPRFSEAGPDVQLRSVGRNEASTFFGFCNHHDTELFRPLDVKPLDTNDREQLFLLAYRGITCELHEVMTAAKQLQGLYTARVGRGVDSPNASSPAGQKGVEQMLLSWAMWRYRHAYYDEPLLAKSFTGVEHDVIEMENQPPCIAASSFFAVKDIHFDEELVGTAINILPVSETKTVVVLSYANQDRGAVRATLDRILNSSGDVQKYELSKLVLNRISNVLISPHHFEKWRPSKVKRVTEGFMQTVHTGRDVEDDLELMLF